ncbi:MAG TPA: RluA family pseudouridine synthase [Candidatus Paceibacterota bacterium]|nr:RluA family pseudouridine synthase [Candidatus Paceibacterota bacterium]
MHVQDPEILFEDANYLVINKPAGLSVHADGRTKELTLADFVLMNFPKMAEVGEPWENPEGKVIPRPGIVHRLDRDTSGVMVLAKNQKTFEHLKAQFQNRETRKIYRAFVYRILKEKEGVIKKPIGKSRSDFRKWSAEFGARGVLREAVTEYTVLTEAKDGSASYLEVHPKTGRTHQIRVHLKSIGHSIVCDALYAPKGEKLLGFDRLALHAFSLSFSDINGNLLQFAAPLPEAFLHALRLLKAENTDFSNPC